MTEQNLKDRIFAYISANKEKAGDAKDLHGIDWDKNCPPRLRGFCIADGIIGYSYDPQGGGFTDFTLDRLRSFRRNVDALCTRDMDEVPGGVGLHKKDDPKYIVETIQGHREEATFFEEHFPEISTTKEYPV